MEFRDQVREFERRNEQSTREARERSDALIRDLERRRIQADQQRPEHHGIGGYLIAGLLGYWLGSRRD
jgi:hypothetical protein